MTTYTISQKSLNNFLKFAYNMGKNSGDNVHLEIVKNEVLKMVLDNDAYFKALEEDLKPKFHED
tara:strand:- start:592 stop:783 length:192 start_codon:yes stop_codon:yes gene_type:complete